MNIDTYIEQLKVKFPDIIKVEIINKKRLMVHIPRKLLLEITEFLFKELRHRYVIVTGIDSKEGYEVIYHYSDDKTGWVINLNVLLSHDKPKIESITPVIYGAEWIERELMDLLGIKFIGHPKPERFLFAESWPEEKYPYRRKFRQEDR